MDKNNNSLGCKIQCGFPTSDVSIEGMFVQMHTPEIELKKAVLVYSSLWQTDIWNAIIKDSNTKTIIDVSDNGDTLPYKVSGSDTILTGDGFSSDSVTKEGFVYCIPEWRDGYYEGREPNSTNGLSVETKTLSKQIIYPIYLWHTTTGTTQSAKSPDNKMYSTFDKKIFLYITSIDDARNNKSTLKIINSKAYSSESSGSARFNSGSDVYFITGKTDVAINNQTTQAKLSSNSCVKKDYSDVGSDGDFGSDYKGWRKMVYYEKNGVGSLMPFVISNTSEAASMICKQLVKIKYDTCSSLFIQTNSSSIYSTYRALIYNNETASDDEVKTLSFYQYGCTQINNGITAVPFAAFGGFYNQWDSLHSCTPLAEKQRVVDVVRYKAYSRAVPFGRNDAFISAEETNKYATPQTFNTYNSVFDNYTPYIHYGVRRPIDEVQNAYIYTSEENNFNEYDSNMYCARISNSIGVDSSFGELLGVVECCGLLYCVQETAISALDYNQRRVNNDLGGYRDSNIKRGDYQYLIKNVLISSMADVCATDFGLVAIVQNNTQMYLIQGQEIIDMSKQYGMQKYYKNDMSRTSSSGRYSDNTNVRLLYDEIRKRLYITNVKYSLTFDFTINSFVGTMPYSNVSAMHKSSSSLNNAVAIVYPDEIYKTNSQEDISSGIKYFGNISEPYIDVFVKPTDMKFAQYYSVEVEANSIGYVNDGTVINYFKGSSVSVNDTNAFRTNGGSVTVNTTDKWIRFTNLAGSGIYVPSSLLRATPDFSNSAYTISIELYVQNTADYLIVSIEGSGYSRAIKPISANAWNRYYITVPAGTSLGTITFYGSNTGNNRYMYMRKWMLERGVTNTSEWVDDDMIASYNKSLYLRKNMFKQLECPITSISVRSDYGKGSSDLFYTGEKPETNTASITKRNGRWYISMPRFVTDGNDNDLSVQQDETSPFKVRPRISETTFNNDRPYGNYLFVRLRFRSDAFVRVREITVTYDTKEIG